MSSRGGDGSEMSDCSSLEEGREGSRRNLLSIRLDRRARRLESNNRERRRMHELNAAFQVSWKSFLGMFSRLTASINRLFFSINSK